VLNIVCYAEIEQNECAKQIEYRPSLVRRAGGGGSGGQDELAVAGRGRRRTLPTHLASRLSRKFIEFAGI